MTDQFPVTRFARGVRLTVQHVFDPLDTMAARAGEANLQDVQEALGATRASWVLPWAGAAGVEQLTPVTYWPFAMPPFQDRFDRTTMADPQYAVALTEFSLSIDQRAEPRAVIGRESTTGAGNLTAADMNRYDMTVRLLERMPSILGTQPDREVLKFEIDGPLAFGSGSDGTAITRENPLAIGDLNVTIKPFCVYVWEVSCPGLFSADGLPPGATVEQLALVSLHLSAVFVSPLTRRDKADLSPIQNLPITHAVATPGTTIPVTTPAANAIITGTDIQSNLHGFDRALRRRAGSGYGAGFGALADPMQASDVLPENMLAPDSHYSMIVVPLWSGQYRESVRVADIAAAGLPYTVAPWALPTMDRRIIPVPEGFVLHHAFAVWNGYSPISQLYARVAAGTWPTPASWVQQVGIGISSGWHGDDYKYQQVAYLEWTGANYTNWLVDEYNRPYTTDPVYRLLQVPLVQPAATPWTNHSWLPSGYPFFMGRGNSNTQSRLGCSDMPAAFGGAALAPPLTDGMENVLEVRWGIDMGSLAGTALTDVILGQGGATVLLVGKQSVAG